VRSHLIGLTGAGICSKSYAKEFDRLRRQHVKNAQFLNQDSQFEWLPNITPARFEQFVLDILNGIPEVCRANPVGHCNEPDGGRDIVANVRRSFLEGASDGEKDSPNQDFSIIVQCKLARHNVGKSSVTDVRDTVDHYGVDGFLLVAYPGVTRPLIEYVEAIRAKKLFWIDCWTRTDLEAQLRGNLNVALRYPHVVKVIAVQELDE
jgi:restriction endonuclease